MKPHWRRCRLGPGAHRDRHVDLPKPLKLGTTPHQPAMLDPAGVQTANAPNLATRRRPLRITVTIKLSRSRAWPENRPQKAQKARTRRQLRLSFHHVNKRSSAVVLTEVVQTFLMSALYYTYMRYV